jgi:hypothetical protein
LVIEKRVRLNFMQNSIPSAVAESGRIPEARYAYYRRCQVFRKGGEQCKAPAETGSVICHAHAGQLAMAVRRERERRAVLEEAVAEMRRRGNPEVETKDLFMDFKGIQVTIAVMARALINGRIDCKTGGRLVVQLQAASKLLRMMQRTSTTQAPRLGEEPRLPQISAEERRKRSSTTKDTRSTSLSQAQGRSGQATEHKELREVFELPRLPKVKAERNCRANQREKTRICFMAEVAAFTDIRGLPHGPPARARAA